jgi:DNA-binding SARP family transcriptional activator
MNRTFFQPQQSFLKPNASEAEIAEAKNWDDNKFEAEANAAIRKGSKQAYVDAGGDKSPASVAARGRFYDYAVKTLTGGSTTTPPTSNNPGFNPTYD